MCRSLSDVKSESSNKIEPQFYLRCIWFFPHTFKNFKLSKTFLSFPGISNEKYFGKKEVCPKQQGQCDGDTEAAPWGAGWRQHGRAGAQGPVPGAAPGQGRALVLLSSQVSDSPCLHRTFWGEVSMISPFRTFFSHINNHTQNLAEEFLSPHPNEGPTYWAPKIILSPPLARRIFTKQCPGLPSEFWYTWEHFHPLQSFYCWGKVVFMSWRRHRITLNLQCS